MQERTKNWLGVAGIIVLLAIAWAALSVANSLSASIQPSSFRSFSVSGEGKVDATPDIAAISFGVVTEGGKDVNTLQAENTKKMNAIIDLLKKNGVAAKDLQTSNYSIQPRTQYYDCATTRSSGSSAVVCPPPSTVGYTISQQVSVKIRDFSKIGTILSGVATAGANNISDLRFTIDDPEAAQAAARAEAIEKAKAKALAVARAGGFRVGRLLSIEEGNMPTPYYYERATAQSLKVSDAGSAAPAIEPGSQDVEITVSLRYEIR
ncbi:MAG: hypothetical protein A2542_01235 [Parcubacteria group bacterium RIFOXYD2_FULL_52_8]|nr:MAG: hypothetical protein A2542_01235 [Parcubacteria group bacterium RIFOXYD2_FULL_52_8]